MHSVHAFARSGCTTSGFLHVARSVAGGVVSSRLRGAHAVSLPSYDQTPPRPRQSLHDVMTSCAKPTQSTRSSRHVAGGVAGKLHELFAVLNVPKSPTQVAHFSILASAPRSPQSGRRVMVAFLGPAWPTEAPSTNASRNAAFIADPPGALR